MTQKIYHDLKLDTPWLHWPQTQRVLRFLADAGVEMQFAGGCVRDALLGKMPSDIDIKLIGSTPALFDRMAQQPGYHVERDFEWLGHIKVKIEGKRFDFLCVETRLNALKWPFDGMSPAQMFELDMKGFDLTINTVAMSADGTVIGYFGGVEDILAGRLRFIPDVETEVLRVPTVMLRYFRFYSLFSKEPHDPSVLAVFARHYPKLKSLPPRRLRNEVRKFTDADKPYALLEILREHQVLPHVLGFDVQDCRPFAHLEQIEALIGVKSDDNVRTLLLVLCAEIAPQRALDALSDTWNLTVHRNILGNLLSALQQVNRTMSVAELDQLRITYGREAIQQAILLRWALEDESMQYAAVYQALLVRLGKGPHVHKDLKLDVAWLHWPETQTLIELFSKNNLDIRFSGGCVRDAILGIMPNDIDIKLVATVARIADILRSAGVDPGMSYQEFGVLKVAIGQRRFDVLSIVDDFTRRGIQTAGLSRESLFELDAWRCDFTINALSMSPDGMVYDYSGGLEDLRQGRVRFITDPLQSLIVSPGRILRFFRFQQRYGKIPPDPAVLDIIRNNMQLFEDMTPERKWTEMYKLIRADDFYGLSQLLKECDMFGPLMGFDVYDCGPLAALDQLEKQWGRPIRVEVRLALLMLMADMFPEKALEVVRERFKLDIDRQLMLETLLAHVASIEADMPAEQEQELQQLAGMHYPNLLLLRWAMEEDPVLVAPSYQLLIERFQPQPRVYDVLELYAPWLQWPETKRLLAIFAKHNIEICFVGGCVRDALTGRMPNDIDILVMGDATSYSPILIKEGIVIERRLDMLGIVKLKINGRAYDLLSAPRWLERHYVDSEGLSTEQAFARYMFLYDFSINTVALSPDGRVYSYFNGVEDLKAGYIRFIKDPVETIRGGPLQLMRYFRFQAIYGKTPIPDELYDLLAKYRGLLADVSGYRLQQEVIKLLTSPKSYRFLEPLIKRGILDAAIGFKLANTEALSRLEKIEDLMGESAPAGVRLVLLALGSALDPQTALHRMAAFWDIDEEQRAMLTGLLVNYTQITPEMTPQARESLVGKIGPSFNRAVWVRWAMDADLYEHAEAYKHLIAPFVVPYTFHTGQVLQAPWLQWPETQKLVEIIEQHGLAMQFAGGCVRDALLGRMPNDIDIKILGKPASLFEAMIAEGMKLEREFESLGLVKVSIGGHKFDLLNIQTRLDKLQVPYEGLSHEACFALDMWRFDFSINTVALSPKGELYSYFGGLDDIRAGVVRFIKDMVESINASPVQILRYLRFHTQYAKGAPDTQVMETFARHVHLLDAMPSLRLQEEMIKLLRVPKPYTALEVASRYGILPHLFSFNITDCKLIAQMERVEELCGMKAQPSVRVLLLLMRAEMPPLEALKRLAARWELSVENVEVLQTILLKANLINKELSVEVQDALEKEMGQAAASLILMRWALEPNILACAPSYLTMLQRYKKL